MTLPVQSRDGQGESLQVLVAAGNPSLLSECRQALTGVPDRRVVLYSALSHQEALDIARDRQPQVVIAEVETDQRKLGALSKELHRLVPGLMTVGAYDPSRLNEGQSEGTLVIELLRSHVRDFLRRPISPIEFREVLDRLFSQPAPGQVRGGRIVSFVSNKGGVGKSTLSVNVGCALAARHPGQVLLVDASLQLGICAFMLDLQPGATILDAARERERLDETMLRGLTVGHESGLRLLAAPADALEATDITDEALARILNLARRTFRYVLVDTFPLLDGVVMTALDMSDLVFLVFQGTAPTVAGVARLLPVLEDLGFSRARQRMVLSRNHRRFLGSLTVGDIEARLERPIDFVIPYERQALVAMNSGRPYILSARWWSRFRRAVERIADAVDGVEVAPPARLDAAAGEQRERLGVDRRSGFDRRVADLGRPIGDRRAGSDRRVSSFDVVMRTETVG
jgi:pilus assembly protein CpaE